MASNDQRTSIQPDLQISISFFFCNFLFSVFPFLSYLTFSQVILRVWKSQFIYIYGWWLNPEQHLRTPYFLWRFLIAGGYGPRFYMHSCNVSFRAYFYSKFFLLITLDKCSTVNIIVPSHMMIFEKVFFFPVFVITLYIL